MSRLDHVTVPQLETLRVQVTPPSTIMLAGTTFAAFLGRDDIRDALVHPGGLLLDELPAGTRVGTSSLTSARSYAPCTKRRCPIRSPSCAST